MTGSGPRHVAVIDIGKTNAKLALVDRRARVEIAVRKIPNRVSADGPYPHHDIETLWDFILDGLATLNSVHPVDAIVATTHGATAALVDSDGSLALPVLDYEHDGPEALRTRYEKVRPPFSETGSPPLPAGLNLGAQLFWLAETFPEAFARTRHILTYPQYWAYRFSGMAASEATSLGTHTDLWNPYTRDFSSLVRRMEWQKLFPPMRRADDRLGTILPDLAARTGVDLAVSVFCGIHDSNASLLPHLESLKPPFAVVSTGTWTVSMAVGGAPITLDPARDTLINVNAFGDPVPSARFMGGREFETVMAGDTAGDEPGFSDAEIESVLSCPLMLMPQVHPGTGPFGTRRSGWRGAEPAGGERFVAASFYLALNTARCLDLIGARGNIIVEGPHGGNEPFLAMLAAAAGRPVTVPEGQVTGTSVGASLLTGGGEPSSPEPLAPAEARKVVKDDPRWRAYAQAWLAHAEMPPER